MKLLLYAALTIGFSLSAWAGTDDFQREGKNRELKDPMEGAAPPALQVRGWLNTEGAALSWEALEGKVVLLDFWGTW
ncbi:MAG: hypothetical protein H6830_08040 [Planctomycetes bacterium]|nr:hypothetical protein [Planctomycetota bacterium]MCB9909773.1 hypothetical protein [Planctomycetota bacterium]MCB9912318.1 hypothetical protein [Planctomycetota bacterium]HPF13811.1 hypothetical protein [Planctomycetota bacterium]HRV82640.1 hypothetical protein [Planctomycetota bacterium]